MNVAILLWMLFKRLTNLLFFSLLLHVNIENLDLYANNLTGSIPASIGKMKKLSKYNSLIKSVCFNHHIEKVNQNCLNTFFISFVRHRGILRQ